MNIYFLVEGVRTEAKVYPSWLSILAPRLTRVNKYNEVSDNSYYLFSSEGYPSILDDIKCAYEDVKSVGTYTHLVICLDVEEVSVAERVNEVEEKIRELSITEIEIVLILQNKCIETWFLGNGKICSRNPQDEFCEYFRHYNILDQDPELMDKPNGYEGSIAEFHEKYLKSMLGQRQRVYSKRNPQAVCTTDYVNELVKRVEDTEHLKSLKNFFDWCFVTLESAK